MAKRKEIKFQPKHGDLMGRQNGMTFWIIRDNELAATCAPAYCVAVHPGTADLPEINTRGHQYFHLDGVKEFCQKIAAGETKKTFQGLASVHYETMRTKDICAIPVNDLCADGAVLFLWVTPPQLVDGIKAMEAWGFTYKTVGDACVYDWQDNGMGDCTGAADHIGIVTAVGSGTFTVTEGNITGEKVGTSSMAVNEKYIRGFICPNYGEIAKALGGTATSSTTTSATSTATTAAVVTGNTEKKATGVAKSFDKGLAGTYVVTVGDGLHIRNAAGTSAASMAVLPKGTTARNYGYYTEVNGVAWLYVQAAYKGVTYTGFCSGKYLSKK